MSTPLPDNTLPMMGGRGPFGAMEMGGMFTVVKVRRNQKPDDYADPGWYEAPASARACEWTGPLAAPPAADMNVRKPGGHADH